MSLTSLSPLNNTVGLIPLTTSTTPVAQTNAAKAAPASETDYTPSSISPSYTYSFPTPTQQSTASGVTAPATLSEVMNDNLNSGSLAGYYSGLGAALLTRYASTTTDYSQMVSPLQANQVTWKPQQALAGDVTLNVTMASGNKVALEISSGDDGSLTVQAHSSGDLTAGEQAALASLSQGFQGAIDAMTNANSGDAAVNVSGLLQYDPTVVSSVNLKVDLQIETAQRTTLNFQENSSNRSININSPNGNVSVNVDLTDPAAIGTKAQQKSALNNYLQQFNQEEGRDADGTNAALMQAFSDSFTQLNSAYPPSITPKFSTTPTVLTEQDHAMLTGLADFQASVSQTPTSPNRLKTNEVDQFTYEMSQQTTVSGNSYDSRNISQQQSSNLIASYHQWNAPSYSAAPATQLDKSQNYDYDQINDSASATTNIGYQNGQLTQASIYKSASQSKRDTQFVNGILTGDVTTSIANAENADLMAILAPLQKGDAETAEKRSAVLAAINSNIYVESDPTQLPFDDSQLAPASSSTRSA